MTQNTSSAVMAQRHEPPDSLDDFPTPPWAGRALAELLLSRDEGVNTVLEPACGRGHLAQALAESFDAVWSSDVHDYGYGGVDDFLLAPWGPFDAIITNPPFRLAEQFIEHGRKYSRVTAMLVRSQFLEGEGRYKRLFSQAPPWIVAQFVERVPMFRGRCLRFTLDQRGNKHRSSTATAYAWVIWRQDLQVADPKFHWISPCRRRLEKWGDYDDDKPGYTYPAKELAA